MRTVGGHFEQDGVAQDGTGADAPHEATLGHLVELGDPVGELGRVVVGDAADAGGELDRGGLEERLGDQQVRRRDVLPDAGEMLAEPRFAVAR
jgi:hypothetical protein